MTIGYDRVGAGPLPVIVTNDWIGDTSTWDGARPYLDTTRFSWVFADLRGYGCSRGMAGRFDLGEAAGDVLDLAATLGMQRFFLVGHSMSSLVALHLAQQAPERVMAAVGLTPPPPGGFGADEAMMAMLREAALGDDAFRVASLKANWGDRLSDGWVAFKAARWGEAADRPAVAAYATMFARDGLPDRSRRIRIPVLAVAGEEDAPPMRGEAVRTALAPLCDRLTVVALARCGHYPMQECPPLLATVVERFLAGEAAQTVA
jgi:pimeloyl-ACP methyl ester carboxylesterase